MATKTPLKIENGNLQQLSSTDTIPLQNLATGTATSSVFLRGDGTWATPAGGTAGSAWTSKTASYTAVAGDKIIADTTAGAFNITLPATPATGNTVEITDGSDWSVNNLTVLRNGSTIEGGADDVLISTKGVTVQFIYSGTTWQVVATLGSQGPQGPQGVAGPQGSVLTAALTVGNGVQYDSGNTFTGEFAKTVSLTNNQRVRTINFIIDGAGVTIASGIKGDIMVDYACDIVSWSIIGNTTGTISIAVDKASYNDYPTFTSSGGTVPKLTGQQKNTSIIDWTGFSSIASKDILRFTVLPLVTAVSRVTVSLTVLINT